MRNTYKLLIGQPESWRQLGRFWCRWENNITVELREIEWESLNWIHLAQDRDHWGTLLNTVMNLRVS
jgi:hypothetical protein